MKASTHTNAPTTRSTPKIRQKRARETQTAAPSNGTMLPATPEPARQSVRDVVRDRLYSREGAGAYHSGNPFAMKFNQALNA